MKLVGVTKKGIRVRAESSGDRAQNVLKEWKSVVQNTLYCLIINNFCFDPYLIREK